MATYFVDDGGDNSDGSTWAKAYTSLVSLVAGAASALTTSGNIIYIGSDHVDQNTYSANHTFTGPSSGLPVLLISSTVGSGTTVSYAASTSRQIDTSNNGADTYWLIFDGAFTLCGVSCKSGAGITLGNDTNEFSALYAARLAPGANGICVIGSSIVDGLVIDLSADGTTNRSGGAWQCSNGQKLTCRNITFVNAAYRTGTVIGGDANTRFILSGADFSGFTNGTTCELTSAGYMRYGSVLSNCLTAATWVPVDSSSVVGVDNELMLTNVGPADAPTYLYYLTPQGTVASSSSIYRTGGATVEGDACSWLITTTALCDEQMPLKSPWIYGTVSSTGSNTFDLYITNDTSDFTDAECWLEVEYLSTEDEAIWALATDQRATITTTAAAQTDDTTSTWNGTGPSFTYKQKLSVTATVNETGQFRARVAVGVASIAGSRYFYVDPKVTVS